MPLSDVARELGEPPEELKQNSSERKRDHAIRKARREERFGTVRATAGMPPYAVPEDLGIEADVEDFGFVLSLLNTIANIVKLVV